MNNLLRQCVEREQPSVILKISLCACLCAHSWLILVWMQAR